MKISTFKGAINLCRAANITPFGWGIHGIGKSSAVRQLAEDMKIGFIDMRLSQCEASDLRGLPYADKEARRTCYLPPADMPSGGMSWEEYQKKINEAGDDQNKRAATTQLLIPHLDKGFLCLDELNRAQDDVLQAVFQLVLDRRVGQYVLPPGWSIVALGNFNEGYLTNNFSDPAFLDRFCHLMLDTSEQTVQEWVMYMVGTNGDDANRIIDFCTSNAGHLDPDVKSTGLGFSIQPSRRKWDMIARIEKVMEASKSSTDAKFSDADYMAVLGGLIGLEAASAYVSHHLLIKPSEIVSGGIPKLRQVIKEKCNGKISRGQLTGITWALVTHIKDRLRTADIATLAAEYVKWIYYECREKDLATMFVSHIIACSPDQQMNSIRRSLVQSAEYAKLLRQFKSPTNNSFFQILLKDEELSKIVEKISSGNW